MKTRIYSFTLMIAALLWLLPQQALAEESPLTVGPPSEVVASEYVAVEEMDGAVNLVDPATLTCANLIDFEDVTGGAAPGTNYDGILTSGTASFAERFAGQALTYNGSFDVLSSSANDPLALQVGVANQNINVFIYSGSNVVDGLGNLGYPNSNAIGEGSIAVLFDAYQFEFGFTVVGIDGGGAMTVNFFAHDGSLIATKVVPLLSGNQTFAFRRAGNVRDIAGISIHNDDPAGIAYDNFVICEVIEVGVDIKPGSCPNPLNTKSKGVLPVAVLGTDGFDVTTIDPVRIRLSREVGEEVAPIRSDYEDVATPFGGELCDCHDLNGDGYLDLTLKFSTQELVQALELQDVIGETIPLTLTGNLQELNGNTPIIGADCIWVNK